LRPNSRRRTVDETDYEKMAERHTKALVESMKQTISEHMTLAWYDPTNQHVSTNKNDPLFTPLGQLWPLEVKRDWAGLTDEELLDISKDAWGRNKLHISRSDHTGFYIDFGRAVEAKLKQKNA
jgi:hypothetical protein